jgi:hypothetical protein
MKLRVEKVHSSSTLPIIATIAISTSFIYSESHYFKASLVAKHLHLRVVGL